MGGMLKAITPSTPKPSQTQSQAQQQQQQQQQQAQAAATAAATSTEQQRRQESLARQRTGRAGTIATSSRGLLSEADWIPTRKSLLGE